MAVFSYRARTSTGELRSGELEAASREAAVKALHEQGLYPSRLEPIGAPAPPSRSAPGLVSLVRKLPLMTRAAFWRSASQAQQAGMSLSRTLELGGQLPHGPLAQFCRTAVPEAQAGRPLSELIGRRPDLFTPLEVGLVRAGEASGRLDVQAARLAAYFERELQARHALRGPMAYLGCLGFTFGLAAFVIIVVAPAIAAAREGTPFSLVAGAVRFVVPIVAVVAGWLLIRAAYATSPALRYQVDRAKLMLPLLGKQFRRLAIARFARSLGELVGAGVAVGEAVEIAAASAGNHHLAARLGGVPAQVRAGVPLFGALAESRQFPLQALQLVATGEETGSTDEMLVRLSEYYDREAAAATAQLTVLGTSGVMLLVALAIGAFIVHTVMGIYTPVFDLLK